MWKFILFTTAIHFVTTRMTCMRIDKMNITGGNGENGSQNQFAIMIDAGSTGSRMFVYTWSPTEDGSANFTNMKLFRDHDGNPLARKTDPGLSSFHETPYSVRPYIFNLLDIAAKEIPAENHRKTFLYILATAGMRLLTDSAQSEIWEQVRQAVRSKYQFKFEDEYARTITGEEEALFGWIAINCILNSFPIAHDEKRMTYGALDMGGASMQIAFELSPSQPAPEDAVTNFEFALTRLGNRVTYKLYAASHLNYGVKEFRHLYENDLIAGYLNNINISRVDQQFQIDDPCLNREINYTSEFTLSNSTETGNSKSFLTYQIKGQGDFDACYERIVPLLKMANDCDPLLCGINGTRQPRINFSQTEFYGLTEFLYALQDVLPEGSGSYDYGKVLPKIRDLCALPWDTYLERLRRKHQNYTDLDFKNLVRLRGHVCFKAVYVLAALHVGFSFPKDYKRLHPVTHLSGIEVQWNLGALVYILNSQKHMIQQHAFKHQITVILVALFVLIVLGACIVAICLCERRRNRTRNTVPVESVRLASKPSNNQSGNSIMDMAANSHHGSPNDRP